MKSSISFESAIKQAITEISGTEGNEEDTKSIVKFSQYIIIVLVASTSACIMKISEKME